MDFDLQPTLENALIKIIPLRDEDFDVLYKVASDPLIWEQHPNKNRYQKEVFQNFFKGAIESKGAFLVYEKETGKVIGSSRYYEPDEENNSIAIGYTFIGRDYWGKGFNKALKTLMFDYAFQFVDKIILHIGETNFRSQKATEKLGAKKIGKIEVAYYGEPVKTNFSYQVDKPQ
jgi:RimJ/RimL family protein N-acetyltransferase